jgi:hypothetical protein
MEPSQDRSKILAKMSTCGSSSSSSSSRSSPRAAIVALHAATESDTFGARYRFVFLMNLMCVRVLALMSGPPKNFVFQTFPAVGSKIEVKREQVLGAFLRSGPATSFHKKLVNFLLPQICSLPQRCTRRLKAARFGERVVAWPIRASHELKIPNTYTYAGCRY